MRYSLFNMRHFEQTIYGSVCLTAVGSWSVIGCQVLLPLKPKDQPDLEVEALGHTDNILWTD